MADVLAEVQKIYHVSITDWFVRNSTLCHTSDLAKSCTLASFTYSQMLFGLKGPQLCTIQRLIIETNGLGKFVYSETWNYHLVHLEHRRAAIKSARFAWRIECLCFVTSKTTTACTACSRGFTCYEDWEVILGAAWVLFNSKLFLRCRLRFDEENSPKVCKCIYNIMMPSQPSIESLDSSSILSSSTIHF